MEHYHIYHQDIPAFLQSFAQVPAMQRLKRIGMNCGCEYTGFPLFRHLEPYTRYDHSLGVAMIIWHFTHSYEQAVSGLLHDVATPVFAHVVDFMNGDYLRQSSTEAGTESMIADSMELQELLRQFGLRTENVSDYHLYPVADNHSPRLSADRLEYSFGNMLNYRFCSIDSVRMMYGDLTVGKNEEGQDEIMFCTVEAAEFFAAMALKCSRVYVSDEDRYAMQILSEILQTALKRGVIKTEDLHSTENEVIAKLRQDRMMAAQWEEFRSLKRIIHSESGADAGKWRQINAKKRFIDPMVRGKARVSVLSSSFGKELQTFIDTPFDDWICGETC